jgi:hypothetical protein
MQAPSIRVHPAGRAGRRRVGRGLVAVAAALALLLAACGDDADGEAAGITVDEGTDAASEDADGTDAAPGTDADTTDPAADGSADDDATDAAAEDPEGDGSDGSEEDATAGGPSEHRPPPAGQPDCAAVTASPPGAIISFPSDDDPSWLDAGPGPVTVEVVGCSDSFEANIQYDAFHGQDTTPTLSGFTQGGTLGNWDAFSFEETYWTPGDWTVVIFVNDAESGNRVEFDEVTFTVS